MIITNDIKLRDAQACDAPFIARVVMAGIDMLEMGEEPSHEHYGIINSLTDVCARNDTLYSYRNAIIAEHGSEPIGALVAYDGACYVEMRHITFDYFKVKNGLNLDYYDNETCKGEFYLDSVAIMPEYRGLQIGKMLIDKMLDRNKNMNISFVTLLVDKDKSRLRAYYESIGFEKQGEMIVFGSDFYKMYKPLTQSM